MHPPHHQRASGLVWFVLLAGMTLASCNATAPATPTAPALANDTGTAGDKLTSDPTITYPTPAVGDVLLFRLDTGSFSTTAPTFFPATRATLVAPMLPLPPARTSFPANHFVSRTPKGMLPQK